MGEMCRANALVCKDDFRGAHEALERARTACTESDFGSPLDGSRRHAAVEELRALLNTNQGVLVASKVRRKRRATKFARTSFDTAASSLETVPKQFKSSRTGQSFTRAPSADIPAETVRLLKPRHVQILSTGNDRNDQDSSRIQPCSAPAGDGRDAKDMAGLP
mmetsp:Transcript_13760/g.55195  ORF Transcript_13760/g.55195 Transcript_13760/m.55195 type:complete len:163 (+) Transcript_13760:7597-8085(+)